LHKLPEAVTSGSLVFVSARRERVFLDGDFGEAVEYLSEQDGRVILVQFFGGESVDPDLLARALRDEWGWKWR
jgi:hypothetical protein